MTNEYDEGLNKRKAIYVKYPQAVPLKYVIDHDNCIFFSKGKCKACEKLCPSGAINFEDKEKNLILKAGSIILATGSRAFDPANHDTFGYKKFPNIVTSLEFERILSASGPYGGHMVRPLDKKEPEKIAWLQCIGSRDEHIGRGYCSTLCCTQATKEAMLAKEHSSGDLDAAIFYIDIRTTGKDYERYYNRAKDEFGVRYIKSKVTNISPLNDSGRHVIRYVDEAGRRVAEEFDMVVLSVGLGITEEAAGLANKLGVELDHYRFINAGSFEQVQTSRPGIYVCGTFQGPKGIPSSVIDASAAAGLAGSRLSDARGALTKTRHIPKEMDIRGESTRIGVFVCCCGTNIAGVVDVPDVVEYAKRLPGVVYAEKNLFSCSQDTQDKMSKVIEEQKLNRIVVAACTPKTHEPLFQETLTNAGLNKYLFEMVNIRNQCSWVHKDAHETATEKAKDLTRMAVAKAALLDPLPEPTLEIKQASLVIGGGVAGMTAAKRLARQGYKTYLVEKNDCLGGNARFLDKTRQGEDIQSFLAELVADVSNNKDIEIFLNAEIKDVAGFVGDFKTTIESNGGTKVLGHGVTIIASGASEFKPDQHLYGKDQRVITGLELNKLLIDSDPSLDQVDTMVFIQCVGSRIPERPYCSKMCCTATIKSALTLKEKKPSMNIFVLHRDIRAYGLREDLYREARSSGIIFVRYNPDKGIDVGTDHGNIRVAFADHVLVRQMEIQPDLLVLASAIVPEKDSPIARFYKVSQNDDGFFAEAHIKLRPVDFATDGVFMCGLAHAPKSIGESITQAQAAAARAVTVLSAKSILLSGTIAQVNPVCCSGCGVCVEICPFSAPAIIQEGPFAGKAEVNPALCKGCGLCVASCRSGALNLKGFEEGQIMAMINES